MTNSRITVHADGACSGNPGPGGWAYEILVPAGLVGEGAERITGADGLPATTNNAMELAATRGALSALVKMQPQLASAGPVEIVFLLDSQYVVKGINEWLANWKAKNWRTASRKPVENQPLWAEIDQLVEELAAVGLRPRFEWVRGHDGHEGNERVDAMAVAERDKWIANVQEDARITAELVGAGISAAGQPIQLAPRADAQQVEFQSSAAPRIEPVHSSQIELAEAMVEMIRSGHLGPEGLVREIRANAIAFGLRRAE